LEWFYPEVESDWSSLVGDIQQRMQSPVPTVPPTGANAFEGSASNNLMMVRLDMNVPMTRNALIIEKYGPLLATMGRVHGAQNFVVVVLLASRPKEDSTCDILEDEVTLTRKLAQHGLTTNLKLIQELTPSQELVEANILQKDTHVVYKLFFMHDSLKIAFGENKWCSSMAVLNAKVTGQAVQQGSMMGIQNGLNDHY
jgi:hypothetical protein